MKGVRGIFGAIFLVVVIGYGVFDSMPGWKTLVDEPSLEFTAGEAYCNEVTFEKNARLRLSMTEHNGRDVLVYWVTPADFDLIQQEMLDDALMSRLEAQMIFSGAQTEGEGVEFELQAGKSYLCMEGIAVEQGIPFNTGYRVEQYY